MDIFEMMKANGIAVPQAPAETKAPKSKTEKKASVPATPRVAAEPIVYKLPLSIYYSGFEHQILEAEYEKESLTEEELLHHMRENFNYRVLTEKRTTLEYDKDTGEVIVHLKNPSKGFSFFDGLHAYKFDDGTCRFVKQADYGFIVGPSDRIKPNASVVVSGRPGVFLNKKVPGAFLEEILARFTMALPNELMAEIYFDNDKGEYSLHWPEQTTTEVSITRSASSFFKKSKSNMLFAEIHSHGNYPGVFSPTDDDNEVDFLIYGVIGSLGSQPSISFRIGFNGIFYAIDFLDVFEFNMKGGSI